VLLSVKKVPLLIEFLVLFLLRIQLKGVLFYGYPFKWAMSSLENFNNPQFSTEWNVTKKLHNVNGVTNGHPVYSNNVMMGMGKFFLI